MMQGWLGMVVHHIQIKPTKSSAHRFPPLLELDVTYFRDPLVMSYGFGVRTMLLGYFIKIDRAWGIETRESLRPRWHFSFGTDFLGCS